MQSRSPISRRMSFLLASLITIFAAAMAQAQETSYKASFSQNKEAVAVNVLVGQSRVINFDRPVGRFSVSNPEIAEAVLVTPDQVLVNGKAFGQVNFIAWEQTGGQFLVFDVYVRANLSLIDSQIRALFPKDDIRLSQANGSVVISGSVSNAATAAQVQSVIEAANFKTVNMLTSPTFERNPDAASSSRCGSESQQTARLRHVVPDDSGGNRWLHQQRWWSKHDRRLHDQSVRVTCDHSAGA